MDALAAAGALHAERRVVIDFVGRRELSVNSLPIAFELFGGEHRERCLHALAHLRLADQDSYLVVRRDVNPGV